MDQGRIGIQDFKVLKNLPHLKIYETLPFSYTYLGFDLTDPLFKDLKVRRAINYAVNRKKILEVVLRNLGEIAAGPIPRASWAYNPNIPQYEYNLKKAKDLIKEAGWRLNKEGILENRRKKFEFNLIYTLGKVNNQKAVILIQSFLKEIGIKVNLRPVEFSVLIKSLSPGKFQAVILDWEETPDPDCFTEWDSSQMGENGMNFMSYKNLKVNRILRIARRTLNMEERKKLYFKFQELVASDAPYVFLWTC
ncbi:MAG: hypothetical protein HYU63_03040 [Armatimonadetes bacterium]|nr:hypothetical protein [Armatimonadota bacterium]